MAVCLALALLGRPALAQSDSVRAAARDLGAEGVEAYQAGNYAEAKTKLNRAFELLRVPTLGLWSARALAKTGKLLEASERFLLVTRLDSSGDVAVQNQAKAEAASEREALLPKIPSLTIDVKGESADAKCTLDGAPLPSAMMNLRQPANPGQHRIAVRDGEKVVEREITLTEGQRLVVTLDMAEGKVVAKATAAVEANASDASASPAAASPGVAPAGLATAQEAASSGTPRLAYVGFAAASLGLVVGGSAGVVSLSKTSKLEASCPAKACPREREDDLDSARLLANISNVGFGMAIVGAALGIYGLMLRSGTESATSARLRVRPLVGLGSVGLVGSF